jgi:hypothetical protein
MAIDATMVSAPAIASLAGEMGVRGAAVGWYGVMLSSVGTLTANLLDNSCHPAASGPDVTRKWAM